MKQIETGKKNMDDLELNSRIEMLAEMIAEALVEESRFRAMRRVQTIRNSPEAA